MQYGRIIFLPMSFQDIFRPQMSFRDFCPLTSFRRLPADVLQNCLLPDVLRRFPLTDVLWIFPTTDVLSTTFVYVHPTFFPSKILPRFRPTEVLPAISHRRSFGFCFPADVLPIFPPTELLSRFPPTNVLPTTFRQRPSCYFFLPTSFRYIRLLTSLQDFRLQTSFRRPPEHALPFFYCRRLSDIAVYRHPTDNVLPTSI